MTRGTTPGISKRIPITQTDLGIRVAAARGLLNYLLRTDQLEAIDGYSLNLNYPSVVPAFDPPYFRCIGREGRFTRLRYWLDGVRYLDFGRA